MTTLKTSTLTGAALDWAVAKCERIINGDDLDLGFIREGGYTPSTYWAQGGPIIEREVIDIWSVGISAWGAKNGHRAANGPTPLIAAMRCYVASKLGDDVDVPPELV